MHRAALIFLTLSCAALFSGEENVENHAIAVVKTWKELSLQAPVEIRKVANAHFGIQALRAPQFSAVMLYCMTDAYDPADENDETSVDRIGPFRITIKEPGAEEPEKADVDEEKILHAPGKRDYGRLLFARVIPLRKLGTHVIELRNSKDALVGSVKVESVEEPFHPWSTLVCAGADTPQTNEPEATDPTVLTAAGTASFPDIVGTTPIAYWLSSGVRGPRPFSENDPLPVVPDVGVKGPAPLSSSQKTQAAAWLLDLASDIYVKRSQAAEGLAALGSPVEELVRRADRQTTDAEALLRLRQILSQVGGPFHIRLEVMTVVIKTPVAFPSNRVERFFLARWRVNGKQTKFDDAAEGCGVNEQQDGAPVSREARLKLKFSAAALGAKSGDSVSLQLMFCPDGVTSDGDDVNELTGQESVQEQAEVEEESFPDHLPLVSNTIEFKVP